MKYLVYLRPPETLSHLLHSFRERIQDYLLDTPGSGDHCTLMTNRFQERDEEPLVRSLVGIAQAQAPFSLTLEKLAFFEETNRKTRETPETKKTQKTLVVLPRYSEALQQLHQEVIDISRHFIYWEATSSFRSLPPLPPSEQSELVARRETHNRYGSPYFGQFYNPHLSIGEVKPELDGSKLEALVGVPRKLPFLGYEWQVQEFYLARKDGGKWREVRRFELEG